MRISPGVVAVALAMAASIGGCRCSNGGDKGDGGAAGTKGGGLLSSTIGPDEFCQRGFGSALDESLGKCTDEDKQTPQYQMLAALSGLGTEVCKQLLGNAVAKKRIAFDGDKAGKCADALKATVAGKKSRDAERAPPPAACDGVVVGLEDAAQPCADDMECKDGLACIGNGNLLDVGDGGAIKDGVCTKPAAIGSKCERNTESSMGFGGAHPTCVGSAFCDELEHTCRAAGAAGAKCTSDRQCASGLSCRLAKCASDPRAPAGGACLDETDCVDDLFCEGANAFDEPPKPGKCAAKKPAGEGCKLQSECKGRCDTGDAGLFDNAKGKCVAFCGSG